MQIATYSGTKSILEKYGISPRKSLGQNFLIDPHVLDKIIRVADINSDDNVLEIGPGLGSLTEALLESAGQVMAVELDKKLAQILKEIFPNLEVIQGDILDYNIPTHINKVVANLPYYITTPIVMHLLENYKFNSITIMVQREVAYRMTGKDFSALSLAVQYHANAEIAAFVPPNSFMPRPKVGSCVVHLDVLDSPPVNVDRFSKETLFANIRAGFGKRRKTLVNCLYSAELYPYSKEDLATIIKTCGFSENIRGETLTLQDWARLTEALREE